MDRQESMDGKQIGSASKSLGNIADKAKDVTNERILPHDSERVEETRPDTKSGIPKQSLGSIPVLGGSVKYLNDNGVKPFLASTELKEKTKRSQSTTPSLMAIEPIIRETSLPTRVHEPEEMQELDDAVKPIETTVPKQRSLGLRASLLRRNSFSDTNIVGSVASKYRASTDEDSKGPNSDCSPPPELNDVESNDTHGSVSRYTAAPPVTKAQQSLPAQNQSGRIENENSGNGSTSLLKGRLTSTKKSIGSTDKSILKSSSSFSKKAKRQSVKHRHSKKASITFGKVPDRIQIAYSNDEASDSSLESNPQTPLPRDTLEKTYDASVPESLQSQVVPEQSYISLGSAESLHEPLQLPKDATRKKSNTSSAPPQEVPEKRPEPFGGETYISESEIDSLANPGRAPSRRSQRSNGSNLYYNRGGEIHENILTKSKDMMFVYMSIVLQLLLLILFINLYSQSGLKLSIENIALDKSIGVIIAILMHLSHGFATQAIYDGLCAYFGYRLSQKEGFSSVVCIFMQEPFFGKLDFPSKLSQRSKVKKTLNRVSGLYVFHVLLIFLTFYTPIQLVIKHELEQSVPVACIEYSPDSWPIDRKWPNIYASIGSAEYAFSNSIGTMKAVSNVNKSMLVMPPVLLEQSSDCTIIGPGSTLQVITKCSCADSVSPADLIFAGVNPAFASALSNNTILLDRAIGMATVLEMLKTEISVTTVITGTLACGGRFNQQFPVCKTSFSNHSRVQVSAAYISDGSIARTLSVVSVISNGTVLPLDPLYRGLQALINETGYMQLPPSTPNSVNPLLKYTTSTGQAVSSAYIETGLDSTMAILAQTAIKRTYRTKGNMCKSFMSSTSDVVVSITYVGFVTGIIFVICQLLITLGAFAGFMPHLTSLVPITPAIELVRNPLYYAARICKVENIEVDNLFQGDETWVRNYDTTLRMGESCFTVQDQDIGEIVLAKPKLTAPLSFDKSYL